MPFERDWKKGEYAVSKVGDNKNHHSLNLSKNHILSLQKTMGNQAVNELLGFSTIQAELKIGSQNDRYEKEADKIADQVMSKSNESNLLKKQDEIFPKNNLKAHSIVTTNVPGHIENVVNSGKGNPIDVEARKEMELGFGGYDFREVRVFDNDKAASSAEKINAKAYTVGENIVFGEGEYSPKTQKGRRLLAHELTHVVQQSHTTHSANDTDISELTTTAPLKIRRNFKGEGSPGQTKADMNRSIVWNELQTDIYQHYPGWVQASWFSMNFKLTDLMKDLNDRVEEAKANRRAAATFNSSFLTLVEIVTEVGGDILAAGVSLYHDRLIDLDWKEIKERIPMLRDIVWKKLEAQSDKFQLEADRFITDPRITELFDTAYLLYNWKEYDENERAIFYKNFIKENWLKIQDIFDTSYAIDWEKILYSTIGAAVKKDISSKIVEEVKPFFIGDIRVPTNLNPTKIRQFLEEVKLAPSQEAGIVLAPIPASCEKALFIKSVYSMLYWQVVQESAEIENAFRHELISAKAGKWISGLPTQALKIFDVVDNFLALDQIATFLIHILDENKRWAPMIDPRGIGAASDDAIQEIAKLRTDAAMIAIGTRNQIREYFKLEMAAKQSRYANCVNKIKEEFSGRPIPAGVTIPYHMCLVPRIFLGTNNEYVNAAIKHGIL